MRFAYDKIHKALRAVSILKIYSEYLGNVKCNY